MATVIKKGEILHIQWFDPMEGKVHSKSTGLKATQTNNKEAEKYAKRLQEELRRRYREMKQIGVRRITLKDAFDHFLRNNQYKHSKTIKDYNRFYKKFTESFPEDQVCTQINKLAVEDWLNELKKLPLALNTIHAYGKQLNHFLNFLFEYNYTPMFRINRQVKTRPEIKEKIIFSDDHLHKIVSNLKKKNSNFKTAAYLLHYTGLRSSEILSITADKIDLKNQIINYYSPKRKKYREIAFHKNLVPILRKRLKELKTNEVLCYSSVENLGKAVTRYLEELKLNKCGYSARTFRKTFITLCRSRFDMDASIVRELVGHEHGNTTDKYYNQITISKMREELKKFKYPFQSKPAVK